MPMDIERIQAHIDRADKAAIKLIERLARRVMREHPECKEFVMAMGSASFTVEYTRDYGDGDTLDVTEYWSVNGLWTDGWMDRPDWLAPLVEVFDNFEDSLRLSGSPMRFTARGPVQHDW